MEKFALIGKTLKHSYSTTIHNLISDYEYELVEVAENNLEQFMFNNSYAGFNVTIPYKKEVMKYLDEIDDLALQIGAVNTVVKKDGKLFGYNTDFFGMDYALKRAGIQLKNKKVMILGSGGTSNTAKVVAKTNGAREIVIVSRSGKVNYGNYLEHKYADIIINTTPVGMYPDNYASPIDLSDFCNLKGVFDAIYNPTMTKLTFEARKRNIKYSNGLPMLVGQAKLASELFLSNKQEDEVIEKALSAIFKDKQNIVLIGMAGCGKSSIAKRLGLQTEKEVIDTDKIIEEIEGMTIPEIFEQKGEEGFRKIESQVLSQVGILTGKIIATGGGVVTREENYFSLKQNGKIIWLKRDPEKLDRSARPLSSSLEAVKKLYEKREKLYQEFADVVIDNNGQIEKTVQEIMEKI